MKQWALEPFGHRMCREQDPESKAEMVWACWAEGRERLSEEIHKDECDRSGRQRCSEENVEELRQERHGGYGYEGGNGAGRRTVVLGGILLGVRPVLVRMPDIPVPCVFGVTDVKHVWWYDDDEGILLL